jgi:putative tricarboxylic transport membrane protein
MNPLDGMLFGLSVAMQPINLVAGMVGALLGTVIGVLPGLGPVAGVALVLPLTYSISPVTGLIALSGIFYGCMYGGSTTSVLLNIPGETASIVTCLDGYQMAKKGRAGAALTVMALGSFIAGTLSVVGVVLFAPMLSNFALSFGPAEFFALTFVGLVVLSRISSGSFARALFVTSLGLLLATMGMEQITAINRFTFGILELSHGVEIVPVAVGLFGISEVLFVVEDLVGVPRAKAVKLRELLPTREEWRRTLPAWGRGSGLGFVMGFLPGPMNVLSTFASYRLEKAVSRHKDEFGKGAIEGVAGPEAANNAAATAQFVPLLSLGLPFSAIMALLMAAMMIHGIQPGPLLVIQHPEIFWGVISSMYIGNVALLILNLPLVGVWVSILRIPLQVLLPCIVLYALIGSYSVRNTIFDLWVLTGFGVLGYFLRKLKFDLAPLILAIVLGPMIERYFRTALFLSRGDLAIFLASPISKVIWGAGLLAAVGGVLLKGLRALRRRTRVPVG